MKLRIRGDSLRLRLSQGELQALAEHGRVADAVRFGPSNALRYALVRAAGANVLSADFADGAIEVRIAPEAVERMATTDDVGVSGVQVVDGGTTLALLVEKDFKCVVPRSGEQDSDGFPNPAAGC